MEYPKLELSNNLEENSMRLVALGRKKWIHIGSPQAYNRLAGETVRLRKHIRPSLVYMQEYPLPKGVFTTSQHTVICY
jgi:Transposase IS66 family